VTDDLENATKVGVEPTDVELVKAYRAGDVHAFKELHRRYVASIYRLVRPNGDALLARTSPGDLHEGAAADGPRRRLVQLRWLGPHRRPQPLL
jgi:hypothetical protein